MKKTPPPIAPAHGLSRSDSQPIAAPKACGSRSKTLFAPLGPILAGFIAFFLTLASFAPATLSRELFFVGDDDFPPFSYDVQGVSRGIDCDIIREMARRMNISVRIELKPWHRVLEMTRQGKCDAAFALFYTDQRKEYAIFAGRRPIHKSTYYLFVKTGSGLKFNKLEDLYGKRIGMNMKFAISSEFDRAARERLILTDEVEGASVNIKKLLAGRIDAFVGNYFVAMHELQKARLLDEITHLPKPLTKNRNAYIVVSRKSGMDDKEKFARQINSALEEMYTQGVVDQIIRKYFPDP